MVRFEVLTGLKITMFFFWVVTSCGCCYERINKDITFYNYIYEISISELPVQGENRSQVYSEHASERNVC